MPAPAPGADGSTDVDDRSGQGGPRAADQGRSGPAMRIMFVCRMFDRVAGGVERMATNIMNAMTERGHEVALYTWDLAGAEPF